MRANLFVRAVQPGLNGCETTVYMRSHPRWNCLVNPIHSIEAKRSISVLKMAPKIISVIGALGNDKIMLTDRYPDIGESLASNSYHEALGGKGANAAIAAYRTSRNKTASPALDEIQVRMIGSAGEDQYADKFRDELGKNGVDCSGLKIIKGARSQVCFNIVEEHTGETRCLFYPGATAAWKPSDFDELENLANGPKPDLVVAQMEIPTAVVEQAIETAGKHGIDFILNAAPADPIRQDVYPYITHLIVNETEAAIMSGRTMDEINPESLSTVADEFLRRGAKNVIITVGEKGAYFANAQERGHVPAFKVNVVDSTGAG
jgi:ribokinase